MTSQRLFATTLFIATCTQAAQAQFNIDWYTIDGGGGTSAGTSFSITGTVGQPDTSVASGGPFQSSGGFWVVSLAGSTCYPNCDGSSGNPLLTANDFQCFINKYAANDSYANCDGSTGTPSLTANDFQCFLNDFAGGCS